MLKIKTSALPLFIAIAGTVAAMFGLRLFHQSLLMQLSLPLRMILMIITQWLLFLVPGALMIAGGETFGDLGFRKEKILLQIGVGIALAALMSLVLTVLPIALGFKEMVGTTSYTQAWKFIFEFIYSVFGVALAEELVFRGYIFYQLLKIKNSRWFAILVSSALFGLFHIFNGNILQVFMTALIGFILCMFREKIKGCTLLSLIVAHGLYDAMIVLWVSIL